MFVPAPTPKRETPSLSRDNSKDSDSRVRIDENRSQIFKISARGSKMVPRSVSEGDEPKGAVSSPSQKKSSRMRDIDVKITPGYASSGRSSTTISRESSAEDKTHSAVESKPIDVPKRPSKVIEYDTIIIYDYNEFGIDLIVLGV